MDFEVSQLDDALQTKTSVIYATLVFGIFPSLHYGKWVILWLRQGECR